MAKIVNKTKVITGPRTRWSYANVWDPKSINGGTPKYSVSLIIPKSDKKTVEAIKAAIQAAYEEGESKLKGNDTPEYTSERSRMGFRSASTMPGAVAELALMKYASA